MKKILLLVVILTNILHVNIEAQHTHFSIDCQIGDSLMSIPSSAIDSITFLQENTSVYQNIWCGEKKYRSEIVASTTLEIKDSVNEYYVIENDGVEAVNAVITNSGNYCFFTDTINSNNDFIAVFGNKYTSKRDYALLDSAGFINSFTIDNNVYTLMYGKDSVVVYNDKKMVM